VIAAHEYRISCGESSCRDATLKGTTQSSSPMRSCQCPGHLLDGRALPGEDAEPCAMFSRFPGLYATLVRGMLCTGLRTNQRDGFRQLAGIRPW
jgi:hypothetical protein